MPKRKPDVPEAPPCVHDEMDAYYVAGSPTADAFAPGVLDEAALVMPEIEDETPWRSRVGWIAELTEQRRRRKGGKDGVELNPESLANPEHVSQAEQDAADDTAPPEFDEITYADLRVLVVHPNLGTRKQVAAILGQIGLQVATCGQAEQAVLQVLHERPDVVLAEIEDTAFDALALCRMLHDRVPEVPVVLVAPGDDEGSYSLAMEAGAVDYLRRPVNPEHVAERLRVAVEHARSGAHNAVPSEDAHVLDPNAASGSQFLSRELRRQELKIQSLFELSRNVVGCLELDELYQGFLLTAMGQVGLAAGVLYHLDRSGRTLEIVCRGVSRREARRALDFRAGLGLYLLRAPQPLLLQEQIFPRELAPEVRALRDAGFGVACPMAAKGAAVGVALFGEKVSGLPFTADDLVMLTAVCNFAGPALEGARLYTELHRTYMSTVRAFVSSLEAKDTYTRGHSERVADYARVLGESLGMSRHEMDMLVFGAVLHDIGKIGVAEGILNKPGPLTPEEWRVVRAHPEMGARIVSNIEYLEPAVGLILHHHERIDGRGYPHGLVGSDIEFGTRIVTVVDSFDAMTTNRPYRKAMHVSRAITLLRGNAGRQFDPEIVERFIDLLEDGSVQIKT